MTEEGTEALFWSCQGDVVTTLSSRGPCVIFSACSSSLSTPRPSRGSGEAYVLLIPTSGNPVMTLAALSSCPASAKPGVPRSLVLC
jgi:hypothetical protein